MCEKPELLARHRFTLGECPTWDERSGTLYLVDIPEGSYCTINYASGEIKKEKVANMLGCLALCENGDLLLAAEDGVYRRTADGTMHLAHAPCVLQGSRFNDGKVGPDGAFYAGTAGGAGEGAFYRLADGVLTPLFDKCTCSNGLDWTADSRTMYYCDSLEHKMERFSVKGAALHGRETVWDIPHEDGLPDGMTIDRNGNVWLALWGGWGVVCIDPAKRRLLRRIDLPVKQVTSCTFAGADLCDLVITTAAQGQDLTEQPEAGYVFRVRLDVGGYPTRRYTKG